MSTVTHASPVSTCSVKRYSQPHVRSTSRMISASVTSATGMSKPEIRSAAPATSRTVKLIPVTPGPSRSKSRGATVSVPRGSMISTTVSSPTRKWSEVEPATVAGCAVQRSHGPSLEDDAFRNDVARPCAVDPRTARCRFAVAGTPTGYAAAPSGTFAADGHGAPSARSRSPMSATSTASRPRRLAVARARADASLGPADVRGLGSNVMLRPG